MTGNYERFYSDYVGNFTDETDIKNGTEYNYTNITSSDDDEAEFYIQQYGHPVSDDGELYYTNCADSDNELFSDSEDLNEVNEDIGDKYVDYVNNSENKYELSYSEFRDLFHKKPNKEKINKEINKDELKHNLYKFLASKYACRSNDCNKPAGVFIHPVVSNKCNYNTNEGKWILEKIGLIDSLFDPTDDFDDIMDKIISHY